MGIGTLGSRAPKSNPTIVAVLVSLWTLLASQGIAIADDRFVPDWQPRTNGVYAVRQVATDTGPDLDLLNLMTGESSGFATSEAQEGPADIDGEWVVWVENSFPYSRLDCTNRLLAKRIDSSDTFTMAENLLGPTAPRISGNLVVWGSLEGDCPTDSSPASVSGESSLTTFDLDEKLIVATLGPFRGHVVSVAIDGSNIIWSQRSDLRGLTSGDIMYVQIGSDAPPARLGRALEGSYDVSGNTLVYADTRNQLTVVDLASGDTTILDEATSGGDLRSPPKIRYSTIDGSHIAWDQLTNSGGWELRAYSLETDRHYVVDTSEWPHQPHLQAGTLVWQSGSDRDGYGVRSASVDDFEQLNKIETRNVTREILVWSGIALGAMAMAYMIWRQLGQHQKRAQSVIT